MGYQEEISENLPKDLVKEKIESTSRIRARDIKCFKCLGKGHIASQCPKKVMILRGKDIYSSEDKVMNIILFILNDPAY